MARVTVEDCVDKVPNRFELVLLAGQRARAISSGASLTIDRDNDKNPVVSLREIAGETIQADDMREEVIRGLQRYIEQDEPEADNMAQLMSGQEMGGSDADDKFGDDMMSEEELLQALQTEVAKPAREEPPREG